MGLPLLFMQTSFVIGNKLWQIPVLLFSILFPALLFFDFISRRYLHRCFIKRIVVLTLLLLLSEMEFYALPFSINQVEMEFTVLAVLLILLFTLLAALLLVHIMVQKNKIVIVQKDI